MPVTVHINVREERPLVSIDEAFEKVFDYFTYVDNKFSTYKDDSEISSINKSPLVKFGISPALLKNASVDMKEIFTLAEQTKKETNGYFDIINRKGIIDPSGIVKGWAIYNASKIIADLGFNNYFVDAGGDIQAHGKNELGETWKVGIENPFDQGKFVKVVYLDDCGMATSGTYIRGQHIYNPKDKEKNITEIVSLSIIGPNVYEADRFATACFAMGKAGIDFVEKQKGLEGYIIDCNGTATMTSGFEKYTKTK